VKAAVTGAGGQLGRELCRTVPAGIELVALDRTRLDIADPDAVRRAILRLAPTVIVNAAAYTAVDRAEQEPEAARAVNVGGVQSLADVAGKVGARLVHVSTDFVFDGRSSSPYGVDDTPNPMSVYAATKFDAEVTAVAAGALVVRTARVYSPLGRNFVTVMLDLMRTRDEVRVVDDQIGSPTSGFDLAQVLWAFAARPDLAGLWHWTDAGSCSWFEWVRAIRSGALERGLLDRTVPIHPVSTAEYSTPAQRPRYSVLDCSETASVLGIEQRPWQDGLGTMLDQMAATQTPS
jgi:dTDP-4-dehydrorhamnose reductase